MRKGGVLLTLGGALVAAVALVAFLAQRPPTYQYPPPYIVARAAELSGTPQPIQVVLQRGADRALQRDRTGFGPCLPPPGPMGCPASIEVRPITVFLVRDEGGALRALIGEDPRSGCALEWMTVPASAGSRYDAVFHDVCHGSIYDRRGQIVGGPSPYNLNELATEVRDGDVYINPGRILVGDCPGCPGFQRAQEEPGRKVEWTPWAPIAAVVLVTLGAALLVWRRTGNGGLGVSTALLVLALASFALGTIATVAFFWGGILLLAALIGFGVAVATAGRRIQ